MKGRANDSILYYLQKGLQINNSELNNTLIGNYYLTAEYQPDSAELYLNQALKRLSKEDYYTVRRGNVYYFNGKLQYVLDNYEKSLRYYSHADDILKTTDRINKLTDLHQEMIPVCEKLNDEHLTEKYRSEFSVVTDISLYAMIWMRFSSKDISRFTYVQHRSVQTKKNRHRKKLHLESDVDLYRFFHETAGATQNDPKS